MFTYAPADPDDRKPDAIRTYAVTEAGAEIGTIALEVNRRPAGTTSRRDWWPIEPEDAGSSLPQRPYSTRTAAAQHLQYRWHLRHQPPTVIPEDPTLAAIRHTARDAGPAAAAWLAAAITAHHLRYLAENRQTHPAALWREIARATTWLEAPTTP